MSLLLNIPQEDLSGVYTITNERNGRKYIGSSLQIKTRAAVHANGIAKGHHSNKKIQKDIQNGDNFVFEIISVTDKSQCDTHEEIKIKTQLKEYDEIVKALNSGENIYNQETLKQILSRRRNIQQEFDKILKRKAEIRSFLQLPSDKLLFVYKHNIYDREELQIIEKELLKRMRI